MTINKQYDSTNAADIEEFAKKLVGKTFFDVINDANLNADVQAEIIDKFGNPKRKGGLGNLLEVLYFGYDINSNQNPDFEEAGVELKVSTYEKTKKGEVRAGERLVITMIGYDTPIEIDFAKSDLWRKIKLILLIYYFRDLNEVSNLYYSIDFVSLFSPTNQDLKIINDDYQIIANKIIEGKAHELSESDTKYLGACTKGSTAEKSIRPQYYGDKTPAKKRAFCLKQSYMTYIINNHLLPKEQSPESILVETADMENKSFEQYVYDKVNRYKGKTDYELCLHFNREYNNNKAQWSDLAYRMLGIKSNRAEEFIKANIVVKSIRLNKKGKMVESMSFPAFKFREVINEDWEDSMIYRYFEQTRFFFVIYTSVNNHYVFKGSQFWNMPISDLEGKVFKEWNNAVNIIKNGIILTTKICSNGEIIVSNNLPKKKDTEIIHVRPHSRYRYYELEDGIIIGNGTRSNANQLPDGRWMTDQCFWLNNDYIMDQLNYE